MVFGIIYTLNLVIPFLLHIATLYLLRSCIFVEWLYIFCGVLGTDYFHSRYRIFGIPKMNRTTDLIL
jgi:hypothetical protein